MKKANVKCTKKIFPVRNLQNNTVLYKFFSTEHTMVDILKQSCQILIVLRTREIKAFLPQKDGSNIFLRKCLVKKENLRLTHIFVTFS